MGFISIFKVLRDVGVDVADSNFPKQIHCPIHKAGHELNLSARVYPDSNAVYCWTCGKLYTPLTLIMLYYDVSVQEAIKIINDNYGVRIFNSKSNVHRFEDSLVEAMECFNLLPEPKKTEVLLKLYPILTMSAKGNSETSIMKSLNKLLKELWPRLV